ncbi:UNVERIFIED_CONTAM: hypothetical protein Sradi_4375800 [Sesamum radiatum]|uniref:Uncharacterized protein n=1 Tax=Sesamum radiatum TaxID=300843 RepID=A0AAW2NR65_SESRA
MAFDHVVLAKRSMGSRLDGSRSTLGSIGLPVEASSFSSHLGVLSQAGWRLSAYDWRCHVPRHVQFYEVVGSLPT